MTAPIWNTPSGQIASAVEGSPFNFNLSFSGSTPIAIQLISGQLPAGLVLNPNTGNISGTLTNIEQETNYEFTIRLTNISGFSDNGLSILVTNQTPIWNNPSNLGSTPPNFYAEYNFSVNDPGGTPQTFEKISGALPPGFSLNTFGKLYGIAENITSPTTYNFTIRAFLDNTFIDQAFILTVDPNAASAPIWLTPAGSLGLIIAGEPFSQLVLAESPQGFPITYIISPTALPVNLTLNATTGLISGTLSSSVSQVYNFSITVPAGPGLNTIRSFSLAANQSATSSITWVTPSGNIGSIAEGQKSTLGVSASSTDSAWLRYALISGSLPTGLMVDINTGEIWGVPQEQVAVDTVFDFAIQASDQYTSITRNFSLTLLNTYATGATRVYAALYGQPRLVFTDLFSTPEIIVDDIYRPGDSEFGLIRMPKILIVENLNDPTADQVFDLLNGVRRTYLSFGKVEVGYAVQNNQVIYEVLYRRIFDFSAGSAQVINDTKPSTPVTIRPGSLTNIREELITAFGSSGGTDVLPLWMSSEQTIGDPTTIPGYVPCLEFAYVLPGKGKSIAANINANDISLKKLYMNYIRIDRIVIEPAASTAFEPQFVLFDSKF